MWVKCISRLYLSSIQPTTGHKISWDYLPWSAPLKICKLKRGNIAFLPPRCTVVLLFELPVKKNIKDRNFEWRGGLWIVLFSKFTSVEDNVSTILSPIEGWFRSSFVSFFLICREKENSGSMWGQITFNIRYTILQLL